MKILSSRSMGELDKRARDAYGIPSIILMENAGIKACQLIEEKIFGYPPPDIPLLFIAGKGNNGGDALVMARQYHLAGYKNIIVILSSGYPREGSDPFINLEICRKLHIDILDYSKEPETVPELISNGQWIFDGIAGTGITGELKETIHPLIAAINSSKAKVIAIDIPSGIGDSYEKGFMTVQADYTVTMGLPKLSLYLPAARPLCGKIHIVKLGFPPELVTDKAIPGEMLRPEDLGALNPPLPVDTYKTRRGHLAVFAGAAGTTGAAWLAATAAARSRTGLLTYYADRNVYPLMAPRFFSVMVREWDSRTAINPEALEACSALLIGPGWGVTEERKKRLEELVALAKPCVIDADGLTLLAAIHKQRKIDLAGRGILTPHAGEFCRFTGTSTGELLQNPLKPLLALAAVLNSIIILKGHVTYIGAPGGQYWIMDGMNPAMATGGTGDVLAGLAAGFLATGMPPADAARKGVLVHSLAGRQAYNEGGWFTAEDLVPLISGILKN